MKNLFLIFAFIYSVIGYSQNCKYKTYYELVKEAKKAHYEKNYKLAKQKFRKAFSTVDFPLGHDLSYALIAAEKTKDSKWAEEIAIQLAKGGIPIRYFAKLNKFKWYTKFKSEFKSYQTYYSENFNLELKQKWIALALLDRKINNRYHEFREAKIQLTVEEMIEDALSVSSEFQKIVNEYGFPGEKEMGYLYIKGKNRIENYPSRILVRHIYQRGETMFENEIPNFVCQGKLREESAMSKKTIGGYYGLGLEKVMKLYHDRFRKE